MIAEYRRLATPMYFNKVWYAFGNRQAVYAPSANGAAAIGYIGRCARTRRRFPFPRSRNARCARMLSRGAPRREEIRAGCEAARKIPPFAVAKYSRDSPPRKMESSTRQPRARFSQRMSDSKSTLRRISRVRADVYRIRG